VRQLLPISPGWQWRVDCPEQDLIMQTKFRDYTWIVFFGFLLAYLAASFFN
jgi:hypothetical protein